MNWNNLHEVTAQNEKPAPGWLFQEIVQDTRRFPHDVPEVAEYLMRCVACDNRTVSMKACLTLRHLGEDVREFRQYMRRCPEALAILQELAQPPQLAIQMSLEGDEIKVGREAARRALASCVAEPAVDAEVHKEAVKQRIQGFGNFEPPPEEEPTQEGAKGMVNKVAGFVGDAVADTVDDFREKGAAGALRDGVADAADLLLDGVGAIWSFLGGRKNAPQQQEEDRICRPADQMRGPAGFTGVSGGYGGSGPGGFAAQGGAFVLGGFAGARGFAPQVPARQAPPTSAASAFQGAFGSGAVGAGHAIYGLEQYVQSPVYAPSPTATPAPTQASPAPAAPPAPAPIEDLLSFDDGPSTWVGGGAGGEDLLSFDESVGSGASPSASSSARSAALELKGKGNSWVRQKKHQEALQAYEAALSAIEGQPEGDLEMLRAVLFANIALCYLHQNLYRRAIDAATNAITADSGHAKAYYRRCLAYKALKMYAEARRDFEAMCSCKHEMTQAEVHKFRSALVNGMDGAAAYGGGGGGAPPDLI